MQMSFCFNSSAYIRLFIKILITTNVNISNGLTFSDVYLSVNYTQVESKVYMNPGCRNSLLALLATQCSLQFHKHKKNRGSCKFCSRPCVDGTSINIKKMKV